MEMMKIKHLQPKRKRCPKWKQEAFKYKTGNIGAKPLSGAGAGKKQVYWEEGAEHSVSMTDVSFWRKALDKTEGWCGGRPHLKILWKKVDYYGNEQLLEFIESNLMSIWNPPEQNKSNKAFRAGLNRIQKKANSRKQPFEKVEKQFKQQLVQDGEAVG